LETDERNFFSFANISITFCIHYTANRLTRKPPIKNCSDLNKGFLPEDIDAFRGAKHNSLQSAV